MIHETDRAVAHRTRVAATLREERSGSTYSADLFERRWSDLSQGWRASSLPGDITEAEQIALHLLLAAAVGSCDDVECDPIGTALDAFRAVRDCLRDDLLED